MKKPAVNSQTEQVKPLTLPELQARYAEGSTEEDAVLVGYLRLYLWQGGAKAIRRALQDRKALGGPKVTLGHVISAMLKLVADYVEQDERGARIMSNGTEVIPVENA